MLSLHRLTAKNFKSLRDIDVPLRSLNVLVGPNGAGKSNFLEVIQFLGDTARMDLAPAIQDHGGLASILYRGDQRGRPTIRLGVEAEVTQHASEAARDVYALSFWEQGQYLQRRESFKFKRFKGRGRRIEVKGGKFEVVDASRRSRALEKRSAALATLPRLGDDEGGNQVRELARLFETFRVFNVDVAAARRPSRLMRTGTLAADASNLAEFLLFLSQQHDEVFALLQEDLRYILPGFEGLAFESIGGPAGAVAVSLEERGLTGQTYLADASFGTIRALALLAMLHDPNPPKLTCVEEIDHGLHPHALDRIVERLRSATARTQLLVATHSPAFVNRLAPHELLVCERDVDTGASQIPAIDPALVREMEAETELGLGELWFTGSLGGVPA